LIPDDLKTNCTCHSWCGGLIVPECIILLMLEIHFVMHINLNMLNISIAFHNSGMRLNTILFVNISRSNSDSLYLNQQQI